MDKHNKIQEQIERINKQMGLNSSTMRTLQKQQEMIDKIYPSHLRDTLEQINKFKNLNFDGIHERLQNILPQEFDQIVKQVEAFKYSWGFPEIAKIKDQYSNLYIQGKIEEASRLSKPLQSSQLISLGYNDAFRNIARIQASLKHIFPQDEWLRNISKWSVDEDLVGKIIERDNEDESSNNFVRNNEDDTNKIPKDVESRLIQVDFLPIKLIESIHNKPELMRKISPRQFEYFIGSLLEKLGFGEIEITPSSNDHGRDIIATKYIHGIPILFAFECKRYRKDRKIKPEILRALIGTVHANNTKANKGVLVTTSSFTRGCRDIFLSEASIDGKDFSDIVQWIQKTKNS